MRVFQMKTYKSSDLTNKRAEVLREAEEGGVIIQQCRTNGDVIREFILRERVKPPVQRYKYDAVKDLGQEIINKPIADDLCIVGEASTESSGCFKKDDT